VTPNENGRFTTKYVLGFSNEVVGLSFSPEEKIKQLEKKVNELIEESCLANSRGEFPAALEKAKEAGRKERVLVRQREQLGTSEQINLDLTYSVSFVTTPPEYGKYCSSDKK
jgi:hypothetical protein